MEKIVSIIIAVYNVEKYLNICLDSLIQQTYNNLEIILVNDGSTDKSGDICENYKNKDNRIKVIHQQNMGPSVARNVGLKIATGEYIYFLDSDDYLNFNCIELMVETLQKNHSDIVVCDVLDVEEMSTKQYEFSKFSVKNYNNIEACYNLNTLGVVVWNKLYKKEIFNTLKFPEGMTHEDEAIICQLLFTAQKITYLNCKLHYYRLSSNSIMRKDFTTKRFELLKAMKIRVEYLKDKDHDLYVVNLLEYLHLLIYYRYLAKHKFNFSNQKLLKFDNEIRNIRMRKEICNNVRVNIMCNFKEIYGFVVHVKNLIK